MCDLENPVIAVMTDKLALELACFWTLKDPPVSSVANGNDFTGDRT